jgi:hypothetical protein
MGTWSREYGAVMRVCLTDVPGQSASILRRVMYELMSLPEPREAPGARPVPAPRSISLHPDDASMGAVP